MPRVDDPIVWTRTWARVQDVFNKFLGNGPLFPIRLESVVGTAAFGTELDIQSFTLGSSLKISRVVGRKGTLVSAGDGSGSMAAGEAPVKVAELSYFFPAHNEEANLGALVEEALVALPALAERFEIIAVDDGSRDRTLAIADDLAKRHSDVFRVVHHPTNLGYGAALRSGFRAARFSLIAFTDGDLQFKVADVGRLTARLAAPDSPDVVVGYRLERADPPIRRWYARIYRLSNRVFFGVRVRDIDCACKLFRREALTPIRVSSGGAFFTAELLIKLRFEGRALAEVGVPHYPRTAGSPTGAKPSVVLRAVRDFWSLRLRLWFGRRGAMRRGEPILG